MANQNQIRLILASHSPRRKQILTLAGWKFETINTSVDETPYNKEKPEDYVQRMAIEKLMTVFQQSTFLKTSAPVCLVSADTIVVDCNDILGKPKDDAEAVMMLTRLRARIHYVYSAIAIAMLENPIQQASQCRLDNQTISKDICLTEVVMRNYSDEEIIHYVASGDARDKAGAYAIQNTEFSPVASIKGCYANVMGLPMCHLAPLLEQFQVKPFKPNSTFQYCCLNPELENHLRAQCCQSIWSSNERNEAIET